jgi:undecaprenol kinase
MIKIKRLFKSFKYALKGLIKVFKEEQNFRIQSFSGIIVILFGIYFNINSIEWVLLIIMIILVLLMEIANSGVERVVDLLQPRINSYVKEIKDIMAAAVMVSSVGAIIVGIIIFLPYIQN